MWDCAAAVQPAPTDRHRWWGPWRGFVGKDLGSGPGLRIGQTLSRATRTCTPNAARRCTGSCHRGAGSRTRVNFAKVAASPRAAAGHSLGPSPAVLLPTAPKGLPAAGWPTGEGLLGGLQPARTGRMLLAGLCSSCRLRVSPICSSTPGCQPRPMSASPPCPSS